MDERGTSERESLNLHIHRRRGRTESKKIGVMRDEPCTIAAGHMVYL